MRWIVFVPVALLAVFSSGAQAQANNNQGLNVTGYSIDFVPPQRNSYTYPECGSDTQPFVNVVWEYQQLGNCGEDMFMIHYTGFIQLPAHDTIQFWLAADDGGTIKIGTNEWGDWNDKGCSAIESEVFTLAADTPLVVDGWFYENGGSTCFMLAWNINDQGWEIVPPEAFTMSAPVVTTTTSTTSSTTTTTTTPATTTTTSTTTTSTLPTTTTTNVSTTTVDPTTTTSTVVLQTTSTSTSTTTSSTTTIPTTTTTVAPIANDVIDEQVLNLVASASELPPEKIRELVTEIISDGVGNSEAVLLSSDASIIESATTEQVTEILSAIDEGSLSDEQGAAIVSAIQNQVVEVRKIFEREINVFDGHTDTYVAVGSVVTIGQRRVIIVASALLLVPVMPVRKPNE
jgi:hypothetical protein